MSARTMGSSISFGDDSTPSSSGRRLTSRVNQPGGTGGTSSVFSDDPEPQRFSSRVLQPGGTGGASSVFSEDPKVVVKPRPALGDTTQSHLFGEAEHAAPLKVHTRVAQPGGTGGVSKVFSECAADAVSAGTSQERAPAPFAREGEDTPASNPTTLSTRVLQPGGTGGASHVFSEAPHPVEEELVRATRQVSIANQAGSADEEHVSRSDIKKVHAQKRAGGGPSKVFDGEGDDVADASDSARRATFAGRKVEPGRTNKSQVALGGGYPDAEPSKRTGHRGNVRSDYNSSQISFGDDTNGAPVAKLANRTSSKVIRPGGTGGQSQILFGDDTSGAEPERSTGSRLSSRVLRPGGTGGQSQISFGDDTAGVETERSADRPSSRVLRPGGTGGASQISF